MRRRVRNDPDHGPAEDGAVVTYSRLSARGGQGPSDRQEPYLEAREVPYRDTDLRAYDPERAARDGFGAAADDLEAPRRGRGRRRGARGAVLVGAVALAAGMVILAYAYGIATRVEAPSSASAVAPEGAAATRGTLPADDAARSIPVEGNAPAAALAPAPESAPPVGDTTVPLPAAQPPATAASGSNGVPMDGDVVQPAGGAQPALVAPVPATATPAAPAKAAETRATANAGPPPAKAAKPADSKPANNSDDLMAKIERLLQRDAATADASGQPGAAPAAAAAPTPIGPAQPTAISDPNALPQLPDANTVANTPVPPADVGPSLGNRLIPPADIPNVAPTGTGTGGLR